MTTTDDNKTALAMYRKGLFMLLLGICLLCLAGYIYLLIYMDIDKARKSDQQHKAELQQMITNAMEHKAEK